MSAPTQMSTIRRAGLLATVKNASPRSMKTRR